MESLKKDIENALALSLNKETLKRELENQMLTILNRLGVYYRCFSRVKDAASIVHKLTIKNYSVDKKMQDLCGIRVVLYYRDDVDVVLSQIIKKYDCIEIVRDESDPKVFEPERLNIVAKLPDGLNSITDDYLFNKHYIDKTFEIQIRTFFSEGWHEIEHDMRYKCKESWDDYHEYSRILNGVWATLSTCDWTMIQLFDDMAYSNYKKHQWKEMIRNKFRLKMIDGALGVDILKVFDSDSEFAKGVFRYERGRLINKFNDSRVMIPITADHIVMIINADLKLSERILSITSEKILAAVV